MTTLNLQRPTWIGTKQPLLYEVAGHPSLPPQRGVLRGDSTQVKVRTSGFQRVTLFLPDASKLVAFLQQDDDREPAPVDFSDARPSDARGKWGAAKRSRSDKHASFAGCQGEFCTVQLPLSTFSAFGQASDVSESAKAAFRLWFYDADAAKQQWRVVNRDRHPQMRASEQPADGVSLNLPFDALYLVQYGHDQLGVFNTILPPGLITIELVVLNEGSAAASRVLFDIDLSHTAAESLVTFLQSGQSDRADVLAETILAEQQVFAETLDPIAALVGCYYFLRAQRYDRLSQWIETLTQRIGRLPDTSVIRGWQLLQTAPQSLNEVRDCFAAAITAGLPIFTTGTRLLVEGLRLLKNLNVAPANAAELDPYLSVISSEQPYTTFPGIDPNLPSPGGAPSDFATLENSSDLL